MLESLPTDSTAGPSNWRLIVRLFGLAWRYRLHCLRVLVIQIVLLTMGLFGLSFTGIGIDYIRHKVQHVPLTPNRLHLNFSDDLPWFHVLALLGGLILVLAICRAVLNYVYAVS